MTRGLRALSEKELLRLQSRMGGCDLSSPERRAFLESAHSHDVQAAPGSGKTTLLVAKLSLLASEWAEPRRGICVLSHTNVAKSEVAVRLGGGADGQALLSYPHYVGTMTTFIHQFLALPYLRGLGWGVRTIDDSTFAAHVLRVARANGVLRTWLESSPQGAEPIVAKLGLAPHSLELLKVDGMPGATSKVLPALERLRDTMTRQGIFRYADMVAIAETALARCPALAARLSQRFPLAFVDEAQDTPASHKALIERTLRNSVVQWLGDCNQGIHGDDGEDPEERWHPRGQPIDLGTSMRFGPRTAAFAGHLTVERAQRITGLPDRDVLHTIYLFDRDTIAEVLPRFHGAIEEAFTRVGRDLDTIKAWAVAAKHRIPDPRPKAWPNCVNDYWTGYSHPGARRDSAASLYGALREARVHAHHRNSVADGIAVVVAGFIHLLARLKYDTGGAPLTVRGFWRHLDERDPSQVRSLRAFILRLLREPLPSTDVAWAAIANSPADVLWRMAGKQVDLADPFLAFPSGITGDAAVNEGSNIFVNPLTHREGARIQLRVGTIASVKGQTHDATLVLETNEHQAMDAAEALAVAFGTAKVSGVHKKKALKNIFVGATRPKHALALAVRRGAVSSSLEASIRAAGWNVVDLTVR